MRKLFFFSFIFCSFSNFCLADEIQDVQCFFNQYIEAANNYSCSYFDFYCNNARIIRVVEKPDGTQKSVDIPLYRYKS